MTDQRDPNDMRRRTPGDYIRRDDGSWSAMAIALVVAIVIGVGYLAYVNFGDRVSATRTSERIEQPVPPRMPTPAPVTPAPTPKQP